MGPAPLSAERKSVRGEDYRTVPDDAPDLNSDEKVDAVAVRRRLDPMKNECFYTRRPEKHGL
jgi:hypothetical protein